MTKKTDKHVKAIVYMLLLVICSLSFPTRVQAEEDSLKKILILNSYHQGFTWSREETEGIMHTLGEEGRNISFYVEYMDWKNYNSQHNWKYLFNYYKYKYQSKQIDLVMVTDDVALKFALEYRQTIFAGTPIVFCGVNEESAASLLTGRSGVTGVIEEVNPAETIQFAMKVNPKLKKVYLLYDNTESGLTTGDIAMQIIEDLDAGLEVESWNNLTFKEVKQRAAEAEQDSIILITTYYRDAIGQIYELDYVNREISERSSVPVYSLYDFGLGRGIIGGTLLSGRMQGENAAKIAGRILDGESVDEIAVSAPNSLRTVFDYNALEQHNISRSSLPPGSEIINEPFSFYETYKALVLSVLAAFAVLLVFIYVLLFYIRKIHKMKKSLSENNEELTQLYEELTASDEEMKQQYDEIIMINEQIQLSEEKLAYLAYHDSLTGLPNKLSLYEETKIIFDNQSLRTALFFIDIDNFKYVNDTMGHAFGDRLIVKVSEYLTGILREHAYLYRIGGDEFIIIWRGMKKEERVEEYAATILTDFLKSFDPDDSDIHISLSIGISIYPSHASNLEELLKYADIAMYQAKQAGKKGYIVYDHTMNEIFMERVLIEKHLRKALILNEFEVYYQPQLDIKTKRITGFEALLRWNSPKLGRVPPMKFIEVAEDTHFILPLGTWVLHEACAFLARLEQAGYGKMDISVNISVLQLLQENFVDLILELLDTYKIEPEYLELEITETILVESFEHIILKLQTLRSHNIRIALDDFGKGYSSLNYLKQLPITTLKVDKSFIDGITETREDEFVGYIIALGKYLGMCVVAEGVEIQCQFDYLARYDCDKIQGFLFCRPVPEEEIWQMLQD